MPTEQLPCLIPEDGTNQDSAHDVRLKVVNLDLRLSENCQGPLASMLSSITRAPVCCIVVWVT